ncbi:hypothetical protein AAF712_005237 [Marasmius tenuissimus]|uniref:Uncharacterized protein n=1 Tax=Marasmius tenuissimus TaxID=585030 RepID=A0ABR3A5H7_9AGAR
MPPRRVVKADQPSPDGKPFICKCSKLCGGPEGIGVWVSKTQKSRHKASNCKYLAQRAAAINSGISPPIAPNVPNIPNAPNISADNSIAPSSHYSLPIGEELPFAFDHDPIDGGGSNVDNNLHEHNSISMNTQTSTHPMNHSLNVPAEEDEYDQPDRNSLNDIAPQQPQPEPSATQPWMDFAPLPTVQSQIKEIHLADAFICELQQATINGPEAAIEPLPTDFISRLRNPPTEPLEITDSDE